MKDLIDVILKREGCSTEESAELYTSEGIPLTNDSYLSTCKYYSRSFLYHWSGFCDEFCVCGGGGGWCSF